MRPTTSRSLANRLWYATIHFICRLLAVVLLRVRVRGRRFVPTQGGVMVLANHQSHFDAALIGLACDRRLNYLARETLFGFAPFRWLIESLDAIPIDREGVGLSGLKEMLRRLKRGEMVLIFPEGARTSDGEIASLKPGFSALAKRAGVPLLPVAIEGAYQAWPRQRRWPGIGVVCVQFGEPLSPGAAAGFEERQLVQEVERRLRECHALARKSRQVQARTGQHRRLGAG